MGLTMSDAPSPKTYPRALAFKPPDEQAEREARLKRWSVMLVLGTCAATAWVIGSGYYFMKLANDRRGDNSAPAADTRPGDAKPADKPTEKDAKPKTVTGTETQRDRFLDSLGKLTGVHLYQCYLNIGLLADCTESDVYTEEEAQKWLDRIMAQMEMIDRQLDRLAKTDLDAEERKGLDRCRQVSALLRIQGRELKEYWKVSDKEHAARYHKAREEAWAGVSDVLQLPRDLDEEMPRPDEPKSKDDKPKKPKPDEK